MRAIYQSFGRGGLRGSARDGALLRRLLRALRSTPIPDGELDVYVAAARRAEWLRGGLGYYRAFARAGLRTSGALPVSPGGRRPSRSPIAAPVLVIWGEEDPFLGRHLAQPPPELAPRAHVARVAGASHDVQLDAPAEVNRLLLGFLGGQDRDA